MKNFSWRILVGVVLVLFGALALGQSLGLLTLQGDLWGLFFGLVFAGVGVGFLLILLQNTRTNWWAAIPGLTLLGLGALVALSVLNVQGDFLPALFMACIGASFVVIYLLERTRWWAIIPGGVLVSVAALILVGDAGSEWPVAVLFGGMALTFGVVALSVRPGEHSRAWAWYPAGGLAVMAVIFAATAGPLPGLIWPLALIAAGAALVAWTVIKKK